MTRIASKRSRTLRATMGRTHGAIAAEYAILASGLVVATLLAGAAMGGWIGAAMGRVVTGLMP